MDTDPQIGANSPHFSPRRADLVNGCYVHGYVGVRAARHARNPNRGIALDSAGSASESDWGTELHVRFEVSPAIGELHRNYLGRPECSAGSHCS